jgi:hypothetical protein
VVFVLISSQNNLWGDEDRYLFFAKNLTHGYYWYPGSPIALANGPGYPIFLAPFVAMNLPLIFMKLLNAILQYLSVVILFKALRYVCTRRLTLFVCLFWACYYNFLEYMAFLYSETLSIFLVSILVLFLIKAFNENDFKKTKKYVYLSGFVIGYLALTKVIFGYVIVFMLAGSLLLWLLKRNSIDYRKGIIVLTIAFVVTLPYLIYTYSMTGKIFYWSSVGGDNLYWMSSPYKSEYGDWIWFNFIRPDTNLNVQANSKKSDQPDRSYFENKINSIEDSLKLHHLATYKEISKYDEIKQDEILKQKAWANIKSHPVKFLQNCISNISRILFNFPYSYAIQKPSHLVRLPLNGIIFVFALFCSVSTIINWKQLQYPIRFLLLFSFFYLGGSVLGSAETRMFTVIVPVLLFWIAFILQRTIKLNLTFGQS